MAPLSTMRTKKRPLAFELVGHAADVSLEELQRRAGLGDLMEDSDSDSEVSVAHDENDVQSRAPPPKASERASKKPKPAKGKAARGKGSGKAKGGRGKAAKVSDVTMKESLSAIDASQRALPVNSVASEGVKPLVKPSVHNRIDDVVGSGVRPGELSPCDWNLAGPSLVGARVEHYWDGEGEWYSGRIMRYEPTSGKHLVHYDIDGEQEWIVVEQEPILVADQVCVWVWM